MSRTRSCCPRCCRWLPGKVLWCLRHAPLCVACTQELGCCLARNCSTWGAGTSPFYVTRLQAYMSLVPARPQCLPRRVYMHHGEEIPTEMPARETSTLFCGAPVAVAGAGVAAATVAPADGAALPRCPASLVLCERRPQWGCGACGRKYQRPSVAAATTDSPACAPAVPACIFCGLLLGLSRPGVLFSPPCCG